ncbi:siderophore biosynthesis protein [Aspergillus ellipticus CBS 707.79]|uniref:Siderophore biosynthesis protein n=1 Tax=Aspergillus ellipticus CBS 707.79 TaxID=1448320 RepID=A0A319D708_9EURO|nr:siderophore biosynthesis protein [Aspergillus ellipticus CBS 707.79]
MRNHICHLPNGQSFIVARVFGGATFKSNDVNPGHSVVLPGWNIVLSTQRQESESKVHDDDHGRTRDTPDDEHRFASPTLRDDSLYISYIVDPPSSDYRPVSSPTRQIAMMLWVTLWWYFHEPEPDCHLQTKASSNTPDSGKPKGDWRVYIKREGFFKGRTLLQKLERMGLIASEDSSVGAETYDPHAWSSMFVSCRSFWQIDPRLFVFTLSPQTIPQSVSGSPFVQPVASPSHESFYLNNAAGLETAHYIPNEGPFASTSHLPTYFPPPPTQYTFTNGIRHPIRPKPPHQGDVFYIRYIPSVQQYLSFRVPYLPTTKLIPGSILAGGSGNHTPNLSTSSLDQPLTPGPSDLEYLHKWMNNPRVNAAWGEGGPIEHQEKFLRANLDNKHSFPVIGCWDGKPFGYFELYWVKEDRLGPLIGGADNYDRGIHLLIGEQEFRGPHRVTIWLSALVHYCWLADSRTQSVVLEPRVDNAKLINYLQQGGFYKEGEVTFPHKQSALMRIRRDAWESPVL